ncbi:nucleotidyltransferase domain-containing protein [Ornithinimicrobium ciconiae]|uniref:nucleotidyltransferase domain-containing protein n=1 Tax=Ornithinimicrobium ciconiae TaxID=2594265 RepID=UPI00192E0574|nr:hypothetical protein [Ornithinimicrobium ciconiae]
MVAELFTGADCMWFIAGGWAIDLFIGRQTRPHGDTDVLVLRRDQHAVQEHLAGWEFFAADPPGTLRPWQAGETLYQGVHDIWCRRRGSSSWQLQLMFDESDGEDLISRRDHRVRMPLAHARRTSPAGIPYLAPEIQLFYKASAPREKDQQDFQTALPLLAADQRAWLAQALSLVCPDHDWILPLTS